MSHVFRLTLVAHAMTDAIEEFIAGRDVVAIMGGHGLERRSPMYAAVARIAAAPGSLTRPEKTRAA